MNKVNYSLNELFDQLKKACNNDYCNLEVKISSVGNGIPEYRFYTDKHAQVMGSDPISCLKIVAGQFSENPDVQEVTIESEAPEQGCPFDEPLPDLGIFEIPLPEDVFVSEYPHELQLLDIPDEFESTDRETGNL